MVYDLCIIGAGPAGTAAGVYAARKQLKTVLLSEEIGGQSTVSLEVQNWIGTPALSGPDLAASFKKHLETYKGDCLTIVEGERVVHVEKKGDLFVATSESGKAYETKTILITSGARRRKLDIPGADTFEHKGVVYCASCDGPLFAGMDTVVIGGGNAGFETAAQLLAYAKSVTLLSRSEEFKADPITVEKVLKNPKMKAILQSTPTEVKGEKMVTGLTYKNLETNETHELAVQGVFVEIGILPNTEFLGALVEKDAYNRITVNPATQETSLKGVWAAGDVTNGKYHQNNIAAGDAVKALEDIYQYISTK